MYILDVNTDKFATDRMTNDRHDLWSERAPHRDKTSTFGQKVISGHKSLGGLD
jgi:hypothetical protein